MAAEVGVALAGAHWAAHRGPDHVILLVVHSSGAVDALETALADRMVAVRGAREVFAWFAPGQIADREMVDALPTGMERFGTLQLPVLLILREQSPGHLHERSHDLAQALPRPPRQVTLAGQGHTAAFEDPHTLASAIREFATALG